MAEKPAWNQVTPQTGDHNRIAGWCVPFLLSGASVLSIDYKRRPGRR